MHVVGFDVEGVETGVLGHGFAVLGDPTRAPDVPCAVGRVQVVEESLLEVVEIRMKGWLAQRCLRGSD